MRFLLTLAFLVLLASPASGLPLQVDVDGAANCGLDDENAVSVELPAGRYVLQPIEGAYIAEHPWNGDVFGCDIRGENCQQGWTWDLWYQIGDRQVELFHSYAGFATPEQALAAAQPIEISLAQVLTVRFWNGDTTCGDNLGGASFLIDRATPTTARSWSAVKSEFE